MAELEKYTFQVDFYGNHVVRVDSAGYAGTYDYAEYCRAPDVDARLALMQRAIEWFSTYAETCTHMDKLHLLTDGGEGRYWIEVPAEIAELIKPKAGGTK